MGSATFQIGEQVKERIGYIPENCEYEISAIKEVETARAIEINALPSMNFTTYLSGKIKLGKKTLSPSKPISIGLFRDGDYFFAENANLYIFGSGKSFLDALKDFKQHLFYFAQYYGSAKQSEFIGEGLRLKKLYSELF